MLSISEKGIFRLRIGEFRLRVGQKLSESWQLYESSESKIEATFLKFDKKPRFAVKNKNEPRSR
jgi:hypothetical protein